VIRPELADKPGAPNAVRRAYQGWNLFKQVNTFPVMGGFSSMHISHDALVRDFLCRLLTNGGTDRDLLWLETAGVMSVADRSVWHDVVAEYAAEEWEDAE
jgi:hypothetical protein